MIRPSPSSGLSAARFRGQRITPSFVRSASRLRAARRRVGVPAGALRPAVARVIGASLVAGRSAQSVLYGVDARDGPTLAGVALGKSARISATFAPSARLAKTVLRVTRVPRNTASPLTILGSRTMRSGSRSARVGFQCPSQLVAGLCQVSGADAADGGVRRSGPAADHADILLTRQDPRNADYHQRT